MTILQLRLKTCLQTILEYETSLFQQETRHIFGEDLKVLRDFLDRIGKMELNEGDVLRLEEATMCFLNEMHQVAWSADTERHIQ